MYISSLSLSLSLSPRPSPPYFSGVNCLETCRFWHMLLPENVSTPAALLGPLITCKKNNNKLGRCLLFQLINWQWFQYNWRQKARKLPVGAQRGIHISLLSHVNQLKRRIYRRLKLPAKLYVFHSRLGNLGVPVLSSIIYIIFVIYTWNSGNSKMSWEMFFPLSEKDHPDQSLLCVASRAL